MNEFRRKVLKIGLPKGEEEIRDCWGINDAYRYLKAKKRIDTDEATFKKVIQAINKEAATKVSLGEDVKFPHKMGGIRVYKTFRKIDPKSRPVNWDVTLSLWEEYPECKERRQLVFHDEKVYYKISYACRKAAFHNRIFYTFKVVRDIKKRLKQNILEDKVEAFLLNG